MSTKRLRRHASKLIELKKCKGHQRKILLRNNLRQKDFVTCICECTQNILRGNIPLSKKNIKDLKKRKTSLRRLVKRNTSMKNKRAIIQSGGFLGAILTPVISILGGLLGNVLGK